MKRVESNIDYAVVSVDLYGLQRLIVSRYVGAYKRGERPWAGMAWGSPGIGKTFSVHAAARKIAKRLEIPKVDVFCVATSCIEPTDVAGVPTAVTIGGKTRYTSYLPPLWAWMVSKEYEEHMREETNNPKWTAPPAILFFDDVVAAHFQTQTAFYKGVHEGLWGDLTQRDNVMVMAAGNRIEDNAGANDMPTALASRFWHAHIRLANKSWIDWASNEGNIHPYIIGYVRQNEDDLNEFNADVANRADKSFACPRTWENLSDFLWEGEISYSEDDLFSKMTFGVVGRGIGTKFLAFMSNTNSVVPATEIVANPEKARIPSRKNLDALHATISSLEHHIRQNPHTWEAGVKYAVRDEMPPDVGILLATTCSGVIFRHLNSDDRAKAMASDSYITLFEKYSDIVSGAVKDDESKKKSKKE